MGQSTLAKQRDLLTEAKALSAKGNIEGSADLVGQAIDKLDECIELDDDSALGMEAAELAPLYDAAIANLRSKVEARHRPPKCPVHYNTPMVLGVGKDGDYWHCKLYPQKCSRTTALK